MNIIELLKENYIIKTSKEIYNNYLEKILNNNYNNLVLTELPEEDNFDWLYAVEETFNIKIYCSNLTRYKNIIEIFNNKNKLVKEIKL